MQSLLEYVSGDFLNEGDPELLKKIRPAFENLATRLNEQGPDATEEQRLLEFSKAFDYINQYEDEIETIERETVLEAIYYIGEIVGLRRETEFAEEWRGDW